MNYKESIQKIHDLDWSKANPARIIRIAIFFAKEFSDTARACKKLYARVSEFEDFISGELDTNNLQYAQYGITADHHEFLSTFFWNRYNILNETGMKRGSAVYDCLTEDNRLIYIREEIVRNKYEVYVGNLCDDEKMATLVSREVKLKGIFQKILNAFDWEMEGYGYYKYFLERHIELDSADGGHEELTSRLIDLEDYEEVLEKFWLLRWRVYKTLIIN